MAVPRDDLTSSVNSIKCIILQYLVGATYKIQVMSVAKLWDDVCPEGEGLSPVVLAPTLHVLVGVGPQEVAQKARIGDVCRPRDASDLLHRVEVRAEAAVAAEDLLFDDGGDGQTVEAVGEGLPHLYVVTSLAFVVESVNSVDAGALVIASKGSIQIICDTLGGR